jgi:copper chaperone CopZ
MQQIELMIEGMHCENCAKRLSNALSQLPGVERAAVSLSDRSAVILHDPRLASVRTLRTLVEDAGFIASSGATDEAAP